MSEDFTALKVCGRDTQTSLWTTSYPSAGCDPGLIPACFNILRSNNDLWARQKG